MIADDRHNTSDSNDPEPPSKSQLKRDADLVRQLGLELCELSNSERARIPLPQDISDAIDEYSRTGSNGARKRQLGWLAKRLRLIDIGPVEAAMESIRQAARANTLALHLVEKWRDRLLGMQATETPAEALTAFLSRYPHSERQMLRQLQRNALAERTAGKSPASARQLFKLVRATITEKPDQRM